MRAKLVYYEGDPSGYALVTNDNGTLADVIVFPEPGGTPKYVDDVPWRAEGGGHTIRKEK